MTNRPPSGKKGVWEPLPLIVYGYAVHPLSQSRRDTHYSNRTRISAFTDVSGTTDDPLIHRDIVSLEVGDEIYAFEKYTPKGKEVEGIWYRGYAYPLRELNPVLIFNSYVVCTSRRPPINWSAHPSTSKASTKTEELQQVFIGIFPASHIYVRDELADPQGRLAEVATRLNGTPSIPSTQTPPQDPPAKEEDPEAWSMARKSFKLGSRPDQANTPRSALPMYPASLRSASPTESQVMKPLPPRFSLKSGDDTASGVAQPIIDEIASALREWHALMFHYLACRDYKLFHLVREHIEALHFGRRQLLVQTLSSEETTSLRRECVVRLVGGNIVQGLDVIVRHPISGALVTVDVDGEADTKSWVSPVRMYAMQAASAYMNPLSSPSLSKASLTTAFDLPTPPGPLASPLTPNPSDSTRLRGTPRGHGSFSIPTPTPSGKARFYHVYLDVRAFVASPCSPGEFAELYFSLYNKADGKFLTEEFCVHLNHNGVLARDPTARIKTLFTDLVQSDVQDPIYLVCRIVRNGAMKMSASPGSDPTHGRRGSDSSFRDGPDRSLPSWDPSMSSLALTTNGGRTPPGDTSSYRRPFGCAVLELTQLTHLAQENLDISATREHSMPIYTPVNETIFSVLHQDIIMGNGKEYEKSPRYIWHFFPISPHLLTHCY